MSHFRSLSAESLRVLSKTVKDEKAAAEQRLVHMAVRESATTKDVPSFSLALARQAGRVDALDNLLTMIYDAERTA